MCLVGAHAVVERRDPEIEGRERERETGSRVQGEEADGKGRKGISRTPAGKQGSREGGQQQRHERR